MKQSVLIVSRPGTSAEGLRALLPGEEFGPVDLAVTLAEARQRLRDNRPDLLLLIDPLPDGSAPDFAVTAAGDTAAGILLLVREDDAGDLSPQVEEAGIIVLTRPAGRQTLLAGIRHAAATRARLRAFERKTARLESRLSEEKLVHRAKLLIMERLKMSEADAHKYIERKAMNACVRRAEIAADLIRTYED